MQGADGSAVGGNLPRQEVRSSWERGHGVGYGRGDHDAATDTGRVGYTDRGRADAENDRGQSSSTGHPSGDRLEEQLDWSRRDTRETQSNVRESGYPTGGSQNEASGYVYSGAETQRNNGWQAPHSVPAGDSPVAKPEASPAEVPGFGVVELAPLRSRAYARMIDGGFIAVIAVLIGLLINATGLSQATAAGYFIGQTILFYGFPAIIGVVWYLYEAIFLLTLGRTPGKLFLGLQVVDADGARKPKAALSFMRPVLPALAMMLWLPGIALAVFISLTALWDRSGRRQSVADQVSQALVVRAAASEHSNSAHQEAYLEVNAR